MALLVPNTGFAEGRFIQLLHTCANAMVGGLVVFAPRSAIRRMVQEIAENLGAIGRIFHRVKNVVMPKHIDIEERRYCLVREFLDQI
jgi:hypothetical protein